MAPRSRQAAYGHVDDNDDDHGAAQSAFDSDNEVPASVRAPPLEDSPTKCRTQSTSMWTVRCTSFFAMAALAALLAVWLHTSLAEKRRMAESDTDAPVRVPRHATIPVVGLAFAGSSVGGNDDSWSAGSHGVSNVVSQLSVLTNMSGEIGLVVAVQLGPGSDPLPALSAAYSGALHVVRLSAAHPRGRAHGLNEVFATAADAEWWLFLGPHATVTRKGASSVATAMWRTLRHEPGGAGAGLCGGLAQRLGACVVVTRAGHAASGLLDENFAPSVGGLGEWSDYLTRVRLGGLTIAGLGDVAAGGAGAFLAPLPPGAVALDRWHAAYHQLKWNAPLGGATAIDRELSTPFGCGAPVSWWRLDMKRLDCVSAAMVRADTDGGPFKGEECPYPLDPPIDCRRKARGQAVPGAAAAMAAVSE